jgi:hypothetical protein
MVFTIEHNVINNLQELQDATGHNMHMEIFTSELFQTIIIHIFIKMSFIILTSILKFLTLFSFYFLIVVIFF